MWCRALNLPFRVRLSGLGYAAGSDAAPNRHDLRPDVYRRTVERWTTSSQQTSPKHRNQRDWGDQAGGGAVAGGVAGGQVRLTCTTAGTAVTVGLDPDQAEKLADQLRVWAGQARR